MVSRTEILRQADRHYPVFLESIVTGAPFFPLDLTLGKTRRAVSYEERRAELDEIRAAARELGFEVKWSAVADPRFGFHDRPESAWFSDETRYLSAIGKRDEVAGFRKDLDQIRTGIPALETWVAANPRKVIQNHGQWQLLLRVVAWMLEEPASGWYLRQLPIPGVHTKFMERNLGLLDELLCTLEPGRREPAGASFQVRHGLKEEESTIRIRFLDDALRVRCCLPAAAGDLSLPISSLAGLPLEAALVFVTENLRNFLAFPGVPQSIVILGHGDAASRLEAIPWLATCEIHYWGDIDARGFAILARFRAAFPEAQSLMMDEATLTKHQEFCVPDNAAEAPLSLDGLSRNEQIVLARVKQHRLRLEQERIPMSYVEEQILETIHSLIPPLPRGSCPHFPS